jgi:hypothetical protein
LVRPPLTWNLADDGGVLHYHIIRLIDLAADADGILADAAKGLDGLALALSAAAQKGEGLAVFAVFQRRDGHELGQYQGALPAPAMDANSPSYSPPFHIIKFHFIVVIKNYSSLEIARAVSMTRPMTLSVISSQVMVKIEPVTLTEATAVLLRLTGAATQRTPS